MAETLVAHLEEAARRRPDRPAWTFDLGAGGCTTWSFGDVAATSASYAAALAAQPDRVAVSALTGVGMDRLSEKILYYSHGEEVTLELRIPQREGRLLSQLHERAQILECSYEGDEVHITVRLDQSWVGRWQLERFAAAELAPV